MRINRKLGILFFALVVIMLGFGIIIPILPFYIESFGASGSALGILMAIFAAMQFLFAPLWGSLSDKLGRKPIMMVGVLGNAISMVLFGLATELWMLFAARAMAGILSSATLPTAMAYVSDTTTDDERGGGMGILGAAMGVGMVIGPGVGGWLSKFSLSTPFFFAGLVSFIAFIFIGFLLNESLTTMERKRSVFSLQGPNVYKLFGALTSPIGFMLILAFLLSFATTNFETIFGMYALVKYEYNAQTVGIILMVIGLISAVVQGLLTGPLTRRFGETRIIQLSLLFSAITFPLMLFATNLITVLLTVGLFIISIALLRPGVSSLISKTTDQGQGIAMGLNNSYMSLGRVIGPLWAGFVFDVNIGYPYISGAVVSLIGFILSLFFLQSLSPQNIDFHSAKKQKSVYKKPI